jgi:acetylornithine deacetylase/succinyl-diaminopimelate desuccinylase-like protein
MPVDEPRAAVKGPRAARSRYPDTELMLMGVEEPKCPIHAPNESVDPSEIENMALSEALFLEEYAQAEAAR